MRLSMEEIVALRQVIQTLAPDCCAIRLFGSRLNDQLRGGDVDIMVDFEQSIAHPALLSARLAVRASRALNGRQVDVLLRAPNLQQSAIHELAEKEGKML